MKARAMKMKPKTMKKKINNSNTHKNRAKIKVNFVPYVGGQL